MDNSVITKTKAFKKGTCPLCQKDYKKGTACYKDARKEPVDRYVHAWCWQNLLWERTKASDPAPF